MVAPIAITHRFIKRHVIINANIYGSSQQQRRLIQCTLLVCNAFFLFRYQFETQLYWIQRIFVRYLTYCCCCMYVTLHFCIITYICNYIVGYIVHDSIAFKYIHVHAPSQSLNPSSLLSVSTWAKHLKVKSPIILIIPYKFTFYRFSLYLLFCFELSGEKHNHSMPAPPPTQSGNKTVPF